MTQYSWYNVCNCYQINCIRPLFGDDFIAMTSTVLTPCHYRCIFIKMYSSVLNIHACQALKRGVAFRVRYIAKLKVVVKEGLQ